MNDLEQQNLLQTEAEISDELSAEDLEEVAGGGLLGATLGAVLGGAVGYATSGKAGLKAGIVAGATMGAFVSGPV